MLKTLALLLLAHGAIITVGAVLVYAHDLIERHLRR